MIVSTIRHRGQMTIPRAIREWLNLQKGDRIAFVRRGDDIVLRPLTRTLLDLRGTVRTSEPQDFAAVRQQVIAVHARKVAEGEA